MPRAGNPPFSGFLPASRTGFPLCFFNRCNGDPDRILLLGTGAFPVKGKVFDLSVAGDNAGLLEGGKAGFDHGLRICPRIEYHEKPDAHRTGILRQFRLANPGDGIPQGGAGLPVFIHVPVSPCIAVPETDHSSPVGSSVCVPGGIVGHATSYYRQASLKSPTGQCFPAATSINEGNMKGIKFFPVFDTVVSGIKEAEMKRFIFSLGMLYYVC
jgi:hypothetical protein